MISAPPSSRKLALETVERTPDLTARQIAAVIVNHLKTMPDFADIVLPLVEREVEIHLRGIVRQQEKTFFSGEAVDSLAARKNMSLGGFWIPGRGKISWGEATEADHLARIEYLERFRQGLGDTIQRHRGAIRLIREAHVKCLNDLP